MSLRVRRGQAWFPEEEENMPSELEGKIAASLSYEAGEPRGRLDLSAAEFQTGRTVLGRRACSRP